MTLIYMLGKNKKDKYLHLTTLDKVSLKSNKILERHGGEERCLFYKTNF
jgi:hypothetical protein